MDHSESTRKSLRRIERRLLFAIGFVIVLVAAAVSLIFIDPFGNKVVRDVARYRECLAKARRDLDPFASAHMPSEPPSSVTSAAMLFDDERGDRGMTLVLWGSVMPADIEAMKMQWAPQQLGDADSAPSNIHYLWDVSDGYQNILLYQGGSDISLDQTYGGISYRERDGTVAWWVYRQWAPFN